MLNTLPMPTGIHIGFMLRLKNRTARISSLSSPTILLSDVGRVCRCCEALAPALLSAASKDQPPATLHTALGIPGNALS